MRLEGVSTDVNKGSLSCDCAEAVINVFGLNVKGVRLSSAEAMKVAKKMRKQKTILGAGLSYKKIAMRFSVRKLLLGLGNAVVNNKVGVSIFLLIGSCALARIIAQPDGGASGAQKEDAEKVYWDCTVAILTNFIGLIGYMVTPALNTAYSWFRVVNAEDNFKRQAGKQRLTDKDDGLPEELVCPAMMHKLSDPVFLKDSHGLHSSGFVWESILNGSKYPYRYVIRADDVITGENLKPWQRLKILAARKAYREWCSRGVVDMRLLKIIKGSSKEKPTGEQIGSLITS
ncbi:hypothetical protein [Parendozoicomonas haliclonae]|uniref:Uncharacterized protein n=1 Tax=Parendozoicomonas haliclonae TaxID=1960125 RepID=A0A1X7ANR3_9GAMM|nr:hypothetical protein [Parendozoicomonas haliclonae]SMA49730.1 hypothetical protein EHSB41UT_03512 [Parendozoicomonas haliclonae]